MDQHFHMSERQSHCRFCGIATRRHKSTQSCIKYAEQLDVAFDVNVTKDNESVHPTTFCTPCYAAMGRILKSASVRSAVVVYEWTEHQQNFKVAYKYRKITVTV